MPRRYDQLLRESEVIEDVSKVLECKEALPLTALIGPNIIIGRSFDSPEAAIAMNFVRATGVQGKKIAPEKRIYATLAVSGEALINIEELVRFLNQLIVLETPPDGFYVLVAAGNAEARTDLFNAEVIAGWMFLNHVLSVKGFLVINGFSDLLTPFLGAAGAEAGAMSWWSNLRTFSVERFSPTTGGGRTPTERYLSCALLNRITYYELDTTWDRRPLWVGGVPASSQQGSTANLGCHQGAEPSACERRRGRFSTTSRQGSRNRPGHLRVNQPAIRSAKCQVRRFSLGRFGWRSSPI